MTLNSITFELPAGHLTSEPPLSVTLRNVLSPRSFKSSYAFNITSMNPEGYSIDAGGSDISVTMSTMQQLGSISIKASNFTNGAVAPYNVKFTSNVKLQEGDLLQIMLPSGLSTTSDLKCFSLATPVGVKNLTCSNVANKIIVQMNHLIGLVEGMGTIEFEIQGIRNPPSFRSTPPFPSVFVSTFDYFNITSAGP